MPTQIAKLCQHKMPNHADTKCQAMPDTKCQTMLTQNAKLCHTKCGPCRHKMPDYDDRTYKTIPTQNAILCRHKMPDHADTKYQTMPTQNARGKGRGEDMKNSSARSDPQRSKRSSAITRTSMLRRWGPRQCEATCVLR